jgi:hypothetical protein
MLFFQRLYWCEVIIIKDLPEAPIIERNWPGNMVPLTLSRIIFVSGISLFLSKNLLYLAAVLMTTLRKVNCIFYLTPSTKVFKCLIFDRLSVFLSSEAPLWRPPIGAFFSRRGASTKCSLSSDLIKRSCCFGDMDLLLSCYPSSILNIL